MIYSYEINGLQVKTGDLICTTDGGDSIIAGQFWRLIGKLIPGDVDHIVIYVGPEGRCVEAGAKGCVIKFEARNRKWDAYEMEPQRRLIDTLYGVAYPLRDKNFSGDAEAKFRRSVADYCLAQAEAKKPYNFNFLDSQTDDAFYCSQLAYKAYLRHDIDLNTGRGVPNIPGSDSVIFPQEIWSGCTNRKVKEHTV
jgi:permuted papain-like amidase YaeF/Yiix C92 family enzyme